MNFVNMFRRVTQFFSLLVAAHGLLQRAPERLLGKNKPMNLIKKTTLALGLVAAACTSFAQTAATSNNGLLGTGYTEFNYTLGDIDSFSDHEHALSAGMNIPVLPGRLDVGGGYTYSWIRGAARGHANTLSTSATAYVPLEGAKPFVSGAIGYTWASVPLGLGDHDAAWSISAGVELPVGAFIVTPKISYADDFNGRIGNSDDLWTYEVEGHYWFSPKAGAYASIGFVDYHRDPVDVWNYRVGLRFKF